MAPPQDWIFFARKMLAWKHRIWINPLFYRVVAIVNKKTTKFWYKTLYLQNWIYTDIHKFKINIILILSDILTRIHSSVFISNKYLHAYETKYKY